MKTINLFDQHVDTYDSSKRFELAKHILESENIKHLLTPKEN